MAKENDCYYAMGSWKCDRPPGAEVSVSCRPVRRCGSEEMSLYGPAKQI